MRHKRIVRRTMGKDAVKKSGTRLRNTGPGAAAIADHLLVFTSAGDRTAAGSATVINNPSTIDSACNVGNVIKYLNLCIEVASRNVTDPDEFDNGWLEYGIVKSKEGQVTPLTTNLGTSTLGDVLTKAFRGDVLWTGCIPVGRNQPMVVDLKIKIPKIFCKLQLGSTLTLYYYTRGVSAADVRTDSYRVLTSFNYKCYV